MLLKHQCSKIMLLVKICHSNSSCVISILNFKSYCAFYEHICGSLSKKLSYQRAMVEGGIIVFWSEKQNHECFHMFPVLCQKRLTVNAKKYLWNSYKVDHVAKSMCSLKLLADLCTELPLTAWVHPCWIYLNKFILMDCRFTYKQMYAVSHIQKCCCIEYQNDCHYL